MKKIYLPFLVFLILSVASCLKDSPAVDFSTVGTIIEIIPPDGGGIENFNEAELNLDVTEESDSADIDLNIASPNPLDKTLTITLAVDDALRLTYNTAYSAAYEAMPDSVYSFPVPTGTIAAGQRLDTVKVFFNPMKLDTTKNYMLPISIKDAQGQNISGNFGTIYFHTNAR